MLRSATAAQTHIATHNTTHTTTLRPFSGFTWTVGDSPQSLINLLGARILKIGQYLAELWAGVEYPVFFDSMGGKRVD